MRAQIDVLFCAQAHAVCLVRVDHQVSCGVQIMKRSVPLKQSALGFILCAGACCSVFNANANAQTQSRLSFIEVTDDAGLSNATRSIAPGSRYSSMQGGGVVGDFNNDGFHDMTLLFNS